MPILSDFTALTCCCPAWTLVTQEKRLLVFGIFPDKLKYAIIKIIPKSNSIGVDNFCPQYLLSVFAHLLERIILNKLFSLFIKHNVI